MSKNIADYEVPNVLIKQFKTKLLEVIGHVVYEKFTQTVNNQKLAMVGIETRNTDGSGGFDASFEINEEELVIKISPNNVRAKFAYDLLYRSHLKHELSESSTKSKAKEEEPF